MATYASEEDVRLRFQLNDAVLAPQALVLACLDSAHKDVLRHIDPVFLGSPPQTAIVVGETFLAGAHVLRALAAKDAADQRQVTIGGQHLNAGRRFSALIEMAALTEERAWYVLEPYVKLRAACAPAALGDSVPVLGDA